MTSPFTCTYQKKAAVRPRRMHVYHKSCIDPWLLEHRTCPMCKADILKYFGYQVSTSGGADASRMEADRDREESPEPPSSSESNAAYNFPPTHDLQDAFHFTPNTSPQLVRIIMVRPRLLEEGTCLRDKLMKKTKRKRTQRSALRILINELNI
ncbi:hypothetical protein NECAME_03072 [Necator americanus]|uniref:RING-type domain-containing protein n=1 Tax=Necator americanus TaxID=51031 RepID=W2T7Q2_NECAM|nr:hypothetical protein NECAME_03072 [Necator americanus]ETN77654.1 hypothetical protein NECAME_03072 [Necator americanus]